ncbi:TetR/AcrR family transcriptional regulator [Phenylobacterium deserti]|uniref:TetR/AcrR family transcriptional regulator n=1 Tax=Phenylobacterium deserti TaxID=1914756 RepID=A0A328AQ96_9CAUL|nr:TetR/AcrR family transcriptional regulator [Phenylobacterium deserti]RAK57183.1 TetR/AcrR family transcriptional regulator [Phenylobacterium deserti]
MVQKEPRPRGRPRSFDADAALEKARAVFWNQGYAATSLDELSAATGLNRPSLYGAFGDKHALYTAALERTRDEAVASIGGLFAQDLPLRDTLGRLYAGAIRAYSAGDARQRGCFLIGTAVTQSVDDPAAREILAGFLAQMDRLFGERFSRAQGVGQLAPGLTAAAAAPLASASLHSLAIRARAGAGEAELHAIAAGAVDLFCAPD